MRPMWQVKKFWGACKQIYMRYKQMNEQWLKRAVAPKGEPRYTEIQVKDELAVATDGFKLFVESAPNEKDCYMPNELPNWEFAIPLPEKCNAKIVIDSAYLKDALKGYSGYVILSFEQEENETASTPLLIQYQNADKIAVLMPARTSKNKFWFPKQVKQKMLMNKLKKQLEEWDLTTEQLQEIIEIIE